MSLIKQILTASKSINDGRTVQDVLNHGVTELGELALEIQIAQGKSYKEPGSDGIIGEALDLIACLVDLIYVENPSITEEDMRSLLEPKLIKWHHNAQAKQKNSVDSI